MSKTDAPIDKKLDAWLTDWPAPERSKDAWNQFGSKLDEKIAGLTIGQGEDEWFDAPLPSEPGEGTSDIAKLDAGGASMSEPESDKPKKKSLKDFAQRVSVAPPSPSADQSPLPKATETPVPVSGPRASSPSLRAASSSLVSRPPEARDSDSGIVDLNAVRKTATSIPDTDAQPAEVGLLEDEPVPAAKHEPKRGSMVPIIAGGLVALAAVAAALVLVIRNPAQMEDAAAPLSPVAAEATMAEAPAAAPRGKGAAEPGLNAESLGIAASAAPPAPEEMDSNEPAARARAAGAAEAEPESKKPATDDDKGRNKSDKEESSEPSDPKDLAGAMATAVGADKKGGDDSDKSDGPGVDPGSIPDTPSQGAIQGALGSVKGAAKACVAGLDGPSRATITFSSNGSVSSVSVSGAAAGTGAAGCIQSALRSARVGPFKRSSFTVGLTIRP